MTLSGGSTNNSWASLLLRKARARASSIRRSVLSIWLQKWLNRMMAFCTTLAAVLAVCSCSQWSSWRHITATRRRSLSMVRNIQTRRTSCAKWIWLFAASLQTSEKWQRTHSPMTSTRTSRQIILWQTRLLIRKNGVVIMSWLMIRAGTAMKFRPRVTRTMAGFWISFQSYPRTVLPVSCLQTAHYLTMVQS